MTKLYIHGLMSSSSGTKALYLRKRFPDMVTPDFTGTLAQRMQSLEEILMVHQQWSVVGSSLGGLMAAMAAATCPDRFRCLVLLAPALIWPEFAENPPPPISVPTVIYHGIKDEVVPLRPTFEIARRVFTDLSFFKLNDDHRLNQSMSQIEWARWLVD